MHKYKNVQYSTLKSSSTNGKTVRIVDSLVQMAESDRWNGVIVVLCVYEF